MNLKATLIQKLLFASLVAFASNAYALVDLIAWQPTENSPKIILPKLDNETSKQAVMRYINEIETNDELHRLFAKSEIENASLEKIELLSNVVAKVGAKLESTKLRVALIANDVSDLTGGSRVSGLSQLMVAAGGTPSVIALSADIGLSNKDAEEFRERVANQFDVLVGMGGDDVDPELYGEQITHSKNVNKTRDRSEFLLIKTFKKSERGVYFGICRGHQLGAVVDGHKLYQDIEKDGIGGGTAHIKSGTGYGASRQTFHHIQVEDSLFLRLLNYENSPLVNSVHHQAVAVDANASSFPVAKIGYVVEALEAKNKMSFSVQFHPEFSALASGNSDFSNLGYNLIKNILTYSRLKRAELLSSRAPRCRAIFTAN